MTLTMLLHASVLDLLKAALRASLILSVVALLRGPSWREGHDSRGSDRAGHRLFEQHSGWRERNFGSFLRRENVGLLVPLWQNDGIEDDIRFVHRCRRLGWVVLCQQIWQLANTS